MTASAWAGAIAGSAFGPIGTAVGAVVVGLGYTFFTESFEVNGKSLKDAVKQITKKAFDHIAY